MTTIDYNKIKAECLDMEREKYKDHEKHICPACEKQAAIAEKVIVYSCLECGEKSVQPIKEDTK